MSEPHLLLTLERVIYRSTMLRFIQFYSFKKSFFSF